VTHEFDGPGKRVEKRYIRMPKLDSLEPTSSEDGKLAIMSTVSVPDAEGLNIGLTLYFRSAIFIKLLRSLCKLMLEYSQKKQEHQPAMTPSDEERSKIYAKFLGYISEAIIEFNESEEGKKEAQDSKESGGVPEAQDGAESKAPALERKKSRKDEKKAEVTAPTIGRRRSRRLRDIQSSDAQQEGSGGKRKQAPVDDEDDEISKKVKMEEAEEAEE